MRVEIHNTEGRCTFNKTIPGDNQALIDDIMFSVQTAADAARYAKNGLSTEPQGPQDGSGDNTALGSAFIFRRD